MSGAPGSLRWLLGKQVRWQWNALTGGQRTGVFVTLGVVALVIVLLYFLLGNLLSGVNLGGPLPPEMYLPVLLIQAFLLTFMISAAVTSALTLLFERGDLDLLLHSPIPPRTVLASRALNVALNAALSTALLTVPMLFILLILGAWRGLGVLAWWAASAFTSASAGLWLTLGLVRWLGVRRTHTVASVVGALFGAAFFLLSQWRNFSRNSSEETFGQVARLAPGVGGWPDMSHPLWLSVQAAWLEPLPTLVLLLGAGLFFAVTVLALTRQFTQGAQEIMEVQGRRSSSGRGARTGTLRFASGSRATLLKEWRLIVRDPELLSRTLLQVVYLIPLAFSVGRLNLHGSIGAGAVLLSASLAYSLARLTLDAEDAPDLLLSAPRTPATLRREKWLAAVLPALTLGAAALLILMARGALQAAFLHGTLLFPLLLLGAGGSALMVLWQPLPVRRADALSRKQQQPPFRTVMLNLVYQFSLSAAAFGASTGSIWAFLPLLIGLTALLTAFLVRLPGDQN